MEIDQLFEEAVDEDDNQKLEEFITLLMDCMVFFYLLETPNSEIFGTGDNILFMGTVGDDSLIKVPTIRNENGNHGVVYTSKEIAADFAEFKCRIGSMKGVKAFQMYLDMPNIDALVVQSRNCNVRIPYATLGKFIKGYACITNR